MLWLKSAPSRGMIQPAQPKVPSCSWRSCRLPCARWTAPAVRWARPPTAPFRNSFLSSQAHRWTPPCARSGSTASSKRCRQMTRPTSSTSATSGASCAPHATSHRPGPTTCCPPSAACCANASAAPTPFSPAPRSATAPCSAPADTTSCWNCWHWIPSPSGSTWSGAPACWRRAARSTTPSPTCVSVRAVPPAWRPSRVSPKRSCSKPAGAPKPSTSTHCWPTRPTPISRPSAHWRRSTPSWHPTSCWAI